MVRIGRVIGKVMMECTGWQCVQGRAVYSRDCVAGWLVHHPRITSEIREKLGPGPARAGSVR